LNTTYLNYANNFAKQELGNQSPACPYKTIAWHTLPRYRGSWLKPRLFPAAMI
jgi:hypothetical protein